MLAGLLILLLFICSLSLYAFIIPINLFFLIAPKTVS